MRLVFLDSGPLGLLTNPRGRPKSDQCRQWVKDLAAAGVRVFVPEIADYEVRRKLIHIQAIAGIRRLDRDKATLDYAPITTDVMPRAAELWAAARSAGLPTAGPDALRIIGVSSFFAENRTDASKFSESKSGSSHLNVFWQAQVAQGGLGCFHLRFDGRVTWRNLKLDLQLQAWGGRDQR